MYAKLRQIVRRAAGIPVVGRPIAILAGLYRLPEYRETLVTTSHRSVDAVAASQQLADAQLAVARTFQDDQLPSLLEAVSVMNHRQLALDGRVENLVTSTPIALRNLARVQQEQVERMQSLGASAVDSALRIDADHTGLVELHAQVQSHADSIQFLLGRVEFVRRELMFELRYGAKRSSPGEDLRAEARIVDDEKVREAIKEGLRVNLGAGHVPMDSYINIDRRELPGIDVVAEVDDLPFELGSVTEIYSAHVLEHFPQEELRRVLLPTWHSLLKPGGRFTAVVPDGAAMISGAADGTVVYQDFREVWFGGQDYDGDFHYNMFTPASLERELTDAGFINVEVVEAARRNGICYEFEITATRPVDS